MSLKSNEEQVRQFVNDYYKIRFPETFKTLQAREDSGTPTILTYHDIHISKLKLVLSIRQSVTNMLYGIGCLNTHDVDLIFPLYRAYMVKLGLEPYLDIHKRYTVIIKPPKSTRPKAHDI